MIGLESIIIFSTVCIIANTIVIFINTKIISKVVDELA